VKRIHVVLLILGALAAADGCGSAGTDQPPRRPPSPVAAQEKTRQAAKKASEADIAATGGHAEAMQVLTAEDRVAAKKQRICPVTGAVLGSMGEPYKVELKNRTVFLCCQGCVGALRENPDKYLKKLEKASAEK
jgi:Cu(I)/Ag(I) efflux system membrane fusion protein